MKLALTTLDGKVNDCWDMLATVSGDDSEAGASHEETHFETLKCARCGDHFEGRLGPWSQLCQLCDAMDCDPELWDRVEEEDEEDDEPNADEDGKDEEGKDEEDEDDKEEDEDASAWLDEKGRKPVAEMAS